MRKLWLVVWAVVPGCGCSSNTPCVPDPNASGACPPIEGSYAMSYGTETDSNACQNQVASPAEALPTMLTLTRMGADLRSAVNGAALSGQVFDDFQFTLHGNTGTGVNPDGGTATGHQIDFNLRGRFAPGATDAGGSLSGTWETTNIDSDCDRQSSFSGTKL